MKKLRKIARLKKLMIDKEMKILSKFIIVEKMNIYLIIEDITCIYKKNL